MADERSDPGKGAKDTADVSLPQHPGEDALAHEGMELTVLAFVHWRSPCVGGSQTLSLVSVCRGNPVHYIHT